MQFQVTFLRPQLSANVAVGARTRWVINKLDWQEDSDFRTAGSQVIFNTQSSFQSDQTVRMLHEDIEYDPARSLYYYTSGILSAAAQLESGCAIADVHRR